MKKNFEQFKNDLLLMESNGLKIKNKKCTLYIFNELTRFADNPKLFETISQDVYNILKMYEIELKPHGIGWQGVL